MSNDTQDLDARVRDAVLLMHTKNDREIAALLHDLHAALKAARGEEFVAWAVHAHDGGLSSVRKTQQDAEWAATFYSEYGPGYTVRRVLCRIAPDDGGEG